MVTDSRKIQRMVKMETRKYKENIILSIENFVKKAKVMTLKWGVIKG